MRGLIVSLALLLLPTPSLAADRSAIVREYLDLLALPNDAANLPDIRRNANHIVRMMERRGLKPRLLESSDGSAPPLVYGEWLVPGASKTLILYAHYDGQPAIPEGWTVTPPYQPLLIDGIAQPGSKPIPTPTGSPQDRWRVYARSASDDKAGVMAILASVDELRAAGDRPSFNLKIVFEGEEEAGSPNLAALLRRHRGRLQSDGWIIIDGPAHQSGPPQVVMGVRGNVNVEITLYGPARPLHSGHYGNWAPNPAMMLARLLASMKDESGRVTIAGFYDDVVPLTALERQSIAKIPYADAQLRNELALGWTEGGGATLNELINQPSLNINGIRSADVGAHSRNVIPTTATAALNLRLVLGNSPDRQIGRLIAHVRAQGYTVVEHEPTSAERAASGRIARITREQGYAAERTPLDHPLATFVTGALAHQQAVVMPSLGGSLPLYLVRQELGAPTVTLGLWNHDNNQHGENENLRLGNLFAGIATIATLMRADTRSPRREPARPGPRRIKTQR